MAQTAEELKLQHKNNLIGGVDNIKLAIEYLLSLQDKQALMMDKMDKELRSRNYIVDKLAREGNERDSAVKEWQQKIKDLENKSVDSENRIFDLNTNIESFKMNYQIFQRSMDNLKEKMGEYDQYGERIAQCERDIADLKKEVEKANRPVFSGKDGVDPNALDDMLDNFKKEMHTLFARREDMESLTDRVKKLEEDYKEIDKNLGETTTTANTNKEEIEKLKKLLDNKLDCEMFDSEIAKLSEAIQNAGGDVSKVAPSPSGGSFGSKDVSKIKEMLEKFPGLEKLVKDLEKDFNDKLENSVNKINNDLKALKDLLDQLSRDMNFLKASGAGGSGTGANPDIVIQITNKIEKLEIKLGNLENELNSMRRAKPQTVSMPAQSLPTTSTVDESRVASLEKKVSHLNDDFNKFNNEIVKEIKNHQDQINGKADLSQLDELRDELLSKIEDLLRGFKQFADKNETKKALKGLEKQLKNLYDLVMSRLQPGTDEDDAMFSKKPLGGFSCASWEKNLINLASRPPDHYSWNKFPLRDPAERIARVGQGFSRMLSSMKPETASRFQGVSSKYPQQYYGKCLDSNKLIDGDENPDHSQPVRTQQNFYPNQEGYGKRPESAGNANK